MNDTQVLDVANEWLAIAFTSPVVLYILNLLDKKNNLKNDLEIIKLYSKSVHVLQDAKYQLDDREFASRLRHRLIVQLSGEFNIKRTAETNVSILARLSFILPSFIFYVPLMLSNELPLTELVGAIFFVVCAFFLLLAFVMATGLDRFLIKKDLWWVPNAYIFGFLYFCLSLILFVSFLKILQQSNWF